MSFFFPAIPTNESPSHIAAHPEEQNKTAQQKPKEIPKKPKETSGRPDKESGFPILGLPPETVQKPALDQRPWQAIKDICLFVWWL